MKRKYSVIMLVLSLVIIAALASGLFSRNDYNCTRDNRLYCRKNIKIGSNYAGHRSGR